jgi:hypothetical protein
VKVRGFFLIIELIGAVDKVSKKHGIATEGRAALDKLGFGSVAPGKEGLPRCFTKFMRQCDLEKPSILSDSFETLRAAAAAGAIVAVLPNRVAKRLDDLHELTPSGRHGKLGKEIGRHKILIVSQLNCDRQEADFLAAEAKRLLAGV